MPRRRTAPRALGRGILALAFLLALSRPDPGLAQLALTGGSGAGGDEGPLRVQADSGIEWQQDQRVYIARGNAVAARGNSEVRADTLIAHYREKPGTGSESQSAANAGTPIGLSESGGGNTEIYRVEAIGNVVMKHQASTVTGERAVYDIDQGIAVITGNNLKLTTATDVVTARDSFEWYDARQIAVARGDAVATRTPKSIKADILTAYMHKSPPPAAKPPPAKTPARPEAAASRSAATAKGAPGGGQPGESRISRVDAQGHVVISDAMNTGRGDFGVYNADTGIATLIGNVVVQRGGNVIQGQRAVMDLNNNVARLLPGGDTAQGKQRVQGLLVREPAKSGATPAGEAKQP
jgi:lipopolysaccharide export system protein LptA